MSYICCCCLLKFFVCLTDLLLIYYSFEFCDFMQFFCVCVFLEGFLILLLLSRNIFLMINKEGCRFIWVVGEVGRRGRGGEAIIIIY